MSIRETAYKYRMGGYSNATDVAPPAYLDSSDEETAAPQYTMDMLDADLASTCKKMSPAQCRQYAEMCQVYERRKGTGEYKCRKRRKRRSGGGSKRKSASKCVQWHGSKEECEANEPFCQYTHRLEEPICKKRSDKNIANIKAGKSSSRGGGGSRGKSRCAVLNVPDMQEREARCISMFIRRAILCDAGRKALLRQQTHRASKPRKSRKSTGGPKVVVTGTSS